MDEEPNRFADWWRGLPVIRPVIRHLQPLFNRLGDWHEDHQFRYYHVQERGYRMVSRLALLVMVLGVGAGVYVFGRPYYRLYEEHRGEARAKEYLAKKDYRNAELCAWLALRIDPTNAIACRVMAEIADHFQAPSYLEWESRAAAAQPTVENQLTLAAASLRYERPPFPMAARVLAALPDAATNNPRYQLLAAAVAVGSRRLDEAAGHFMAASALEPSNRVNLLNLAAMRLATTNDASRREARLCLETLARDPEVGPRALRTLAADRLADHDLAGAQKYSAELLASGGADISDRLQNLEILRRLTNDAFASRLKELEAAAAINAADVGQVSAWMLGNSLAAENLAWLTNLPAAMQAEQPVQLALADGWCATGNWRALRDFVSRGNWGQLEYLRFALVSEACSKTDSYGLSGVNWTSAVNEANTTRNPLPCLKKLAELAQLWGLNLEQEQVLEQVVEDYPQERWATASLSRLYIEEGKTAALNELSARMARQFPNDVVFKNNLAATELLLKTNFSAACALAEAAYTNAPASADEATTYAFALHLEGRDAEGLALLEKLPAAALQEPAAALYYGILLGAAGKHEAAAAALEIARTNAHLLPEEKALLATALGK